MNDVNLVRTRQEIEYHHKLADLAAVIDDSGVPDPTSLEHIFAHGTYTRVLHLPADTVIVGMIHRHSCINIIPKGRIVVTLGDGESKEIVAPAYFVSEPGIQKAGYAIEDTIWINVVPNPDELRDIAQLEHITVYPSLEALAAEQRQQIEEL